MLGDLPNILDRFESLRILHETSADLSERIVKLNEVNKEILEIVGNNNELL